MQLALKKEMSRLRVLEGLKTRRVDSVENDAVRTAIEIAYNADQFREELTKGNLKIFVQPADRNQVISSAIEANRIMETKPTGMDEKEENYVAHSLIQLERLLHLPDTLDSFAKELQRKAKELKARSKKLRKELRPAKQIVEGDILDKVYVLAPKAAKRVLRGNPEQVRYKWIKNF